nr:TetR/AcrR family transcriptional regulator [Frankia sp. CcI49]
MRPTRDQTRRQLFEAAADVFDAHGIGGASVETIAAAAGLTRGAFYSNFDNKDELISAMLADHVEQTVRRHLELLIAHRTATDFVQALTAMDRGTQDPLGRSPLLHIELLLYAARAAERRPEVAEPLRARRRLIADIVRAIAGETRVDPEQIAAMLLAMEDGFRLHRLIDPDTTPNDSFLRAIGELQHLLGPGTRDQHQPGNDTAAH